MKFLSNIFSKKKEKVLDHHNLSLVLTPFELSVYKNVIADMNRSHREVPGNTDLLLSYKTEKMPYRELYVVDITCLNSYASRCYHQLGISAQTAILLSKKNNEKIDNPIIPYTV